MHRIFPIMFILMITVGCRPALYHFTFPRENRPVASSFIATNEYHLAGSPNPEIALYVVAADPGRSRPGIVCYVPTQFEIVHDQSGPEFWKSKSRGKVEYFFVVAPAIDREKYKNLRDAITSNTPGVTATLVPCEVLLNSIEVPGTLAKVRINMVSYYGVSGDLFWIVRLRANNRLEEQLENLMRSVPGLLLPTQATLSGVNLSITPPVEIRATVPARQH